VTGGIPSACRVIVISLGVLGAGGSSGCGVGVAAGCTWGGGNCGEWWRFDRYLGDLDLVRALVSDEWWDGWWCLLDLDLDLLLVVVGFLDDFLRLSWSGVLLAELVVLEPGVTVGVDWPEWSSEKVECPRGCRLRTSESSDWLATRQLRSRCLRRSCGLVKVARHPGVVQGSFARFPWVVSLWRVMFPWLEKVFLQIEQRYSDIRGCMFLCVMLHE